MIEHVRLHIVDVFFHVQPENSYSFRAFGLS